MNTGTCHQGRVNQCGLPATVVLVTTGTGFLIEVCTRHALEIVDPYRRWR